MKTQWTVSPGTEDASAKSIGPIEFQSRDGEWHDFEIVHAANRLVFGGACNAGFLESGYLDLEDDETVDDGLEGLLADLVVYYNDGPNYVSRIIHNERM